MKFYTVICTLFFVVSAYAGNRDNIRFDHISTGQGLSQSTVLSILQDSKGFMWFGSYGGLNRYDGKRMRTFRAGSGLSHNTVNAICRDELKKGSFLWLGTDGGLDKMDLQTETITQYNLLVHTPPALKEQRIKALHIDNQGNLWIGTDGGGLFKYVNKRNTFINFLYSPKNTVSISGNHIRCFYYSKKDKNILWIGTNNGLNRLDTAKLTFSSYRHQPDNPESISENDITAIAADKQGLIWVGTWKMGLNRFNPATGKFKRFSRQTIRAIYLDRSGTLWVGTLGGGLKTLSSGETSGTNNPTFISYGNDPGDPDSLSSNRVMCIYEDRSGLMWFGTDFGGLNTFNPRQRHFSMHKVPPVAKGETSGEPGNNNITAIHVPANDDKIMWLGTLSGGLKKYFRQSGRYIHYTHNPLDKRSISSNTIRAIFSQEGELWIGTERGLNRMDIKTGRFTHFRADANKKNSLSNDNVYAICSGGQGKLWIGTFYGGLDLFDIQKKTFTRFKHEPGKTGSLNDHIVWSLLRDSTGTLWVGTDRGGLNRYDPNKKKFIHYMDKPGNKGYRLSSNKILTMFEDAGGDLWLGTANGLNRMHRRATKRKNRSSVYFSHYSPARQKNLSIHSIQADKAGHLWLGTLSGLMRFNPGDETFKRFDAGPGLQGNEFNVNSSFSSGGELFFGGINGFNSFFPQHIKDNRHIPAIVITGFQILNRPVLIGKQPDGRTILEKSITYTTYMQLLHTDNSVTFEFTALEYVSPHSIQYAYNLEGFDGFHWQRVGNRNYATYTNLPHGDYTFRVKSTNSDGTWNENGTAVSFRVSPPWWKTWWAYLLYPIFFIGMFFFFKKFGMKYLFFYAFWKKEKYIGQYKLLEKIADGGMGAVYKACHIQDKTKNLAVKILKEQLAANPCNIKRFKREAAIIDQLHHPNILKIVERGQFNEKLYIVSEYLPGKTMQETLDTQPLMSLTRSLDIMVQVSEAIREIHCQGIIHRDLKAENIMIPPPHLPGNCVKVLDFGLARMEFQQRLTQTGVLVGTVGYMAPEQISRGEFTAAGDIHALGIIFYFMLTGEKTFVGDTATDIMRRILEDTPPAPISIRLEIPAQMDQLIMSMLAKKPEERPTAEDILTVLKRL